MKQDTSTAQGEASGASKVIKGNLSDEKTSL